MDRDPKRVLEDYLDDYITAEIATEGYGIVIDKRTRRSTKRPPLAARTTRTMETATTGTELRYPLSTPSSASLSFLCHALRVFVTGVAS